MFARLSLTIRMGIHSLLLHGLRSFLAIVGIAIGIVAVIWLVAAGEGISYQAQQQIKDLGANNIIVRSVKPSQGSSRAGGGLFLTYGLTRSDYAAIAKNLDTVPQIVPLREYRMEFRNGDKTFDGRLVGCSSTYKELNNLKMADGVFIEHKHGEKLLNVCVLSEGVAKGLFPLSNPIGQKIQINSDFYLVMGVTESRLPTAAMGGSLSAQDYNQDVYIPIETWKARLGDTMFTSRNGGNEGEIVELNQITVRVNDVSEVDHTAEVIRHILDRSHKDKFDTAVVVPKELLEQAELFRLMFNVLLIVIAGISLLVGGIGIMNIMLATVTERTREIGIRRALGAKQSDIIKQFLVESAMLTFVGGVIGIIIGLLCSPFFASLKMLLQQVDAELYTSLPKWIIDLEPRIAPWSVLASFFISIFVGVFFGLYPAWRAAKLDPIEALRHE